GSGSYNTRTQSMEIIAASVAHPQWRAVQDMFALNPAIIGHCEAPAAGQDYPRFRLSGIGQEKVDFQVVLYRRHTRQSMRFYTFDFNELDILPLQDSAQDKLPAATRNANASLEADFTRTRGPASQRGSALDEEVLLQANFAQLFADIVNNRLNVATPASPSRVADASPRGHSAPTASQRPSGYREGVLQTRFASAVKTLHGLRDLSTTAGQFDVRFEQGAYVAGEVPHVYHDKARTVVSISKYIKFHNCVWLVLNDAIIGVAFGSFLCENSDVLARMSEDFLQHYLVHRMELALLWLNNWPAGLKLNTELSQFYCHSLIGIVSAWGWLLARMAPYFPILIWLIGISGCLGMTMIVSLLSDTLSVLTAHLYACYFISAMVFRHQLSLAGSLWNLFRGKRYNVLRNRIDTWDYDLDQLLLGTILFTLLAFLYPTVLTYYALFAAARLAVMMIHAVFDTVTALLNHFPLFALLLRVKDPLRLPVRKLRIFELQGFELKLFQILVGRNYGKTFLPYLREFAYGSCRREDTGLMELGLLASTSVHTLELCSNAFNYFHGERLDLWLTWTLSNLFPHLQHLTLGIEAATGASTNFFASFVALKQLRHLIVKKPIVLAEPAHLQALVSALPQLESLNASIAWSVVPPPKSERTSAPSLRRLSIYGPWQDLARFPSLLQCPALEELELSMKPTTGPVSLVNCDTLCACVHDVVEPHFAPRLRRLVIDAPVTHQIRRNRTSVVAVPERRSIADILGPLSALEHLEDVQFTMAFVVQASLFTPGLSDGDMRALAVALRHVRTISLQIEYPADARPSPAPTLLSLVHFASLCPRLVSLSLPYVNTMTSIPASARNKDESPPLCKTLRTLRLQDASPPSESETCRLAAFLCGLFPSLDVAAFTLSQDPTMEAVVRERMCALRAESGR
ncbi:N-acetylglucosaminyl-phosphatidylinositol biosynthetic protein gpi1, partial [Trametes pubescens]